MKYTNNNGLPSAFLNICEDDDGHEVKENVYHVTELLQPITMTILKRRHDKTITVDVSQCVWLVFGKSVHSMFEKNDKTGYAEYPVSAKIGDVTLTGRVDLYNENTHAIEDYKTTTAWKIKNQDFEDWRKQGLMYAWLMMKQGHVVEKLRFHALLKDWSNNQLRSDLRKGNEGYPTTPVYTWEYDVHTTDLVEIEKYIKDRLHDLKLAERLTDDELPNCTPEERWNSGTRYAVMRGKMKKALRVFPTRLEAEAYIKRTPEYNCWVEERLGDDRRCEDYCFACVYCPYYKALSRAEGGNE